MTTTDPTTPTLAPELRDALVRIGVPVDAHRYPPAPSNPYGVPDELRADYLAAAAQPRHVAKAMEMAHTQEPGAMLNYAGRDISDQLGQTPDHPADQAALVERGEFAKLARQHGVTPDTWAAHGHLLGLARTAVTQRGISQAYRDTDRRLSVCQVTGREDRTTRSRRIPWVPNHPDKRVSDRGELALLAVLLEQVTDQDKAAALAWLREHGWEPDRETRDTDTGRRRRRH